MKGQRIIIILIILAALLPAYYVHQWLQQLIQPRRSFAQLLLFMLLSMLLAFAWTFLIILLISKLFPIAKGETFIFTG